MWIYHCGQIPNFPFSSDGGNCKDFEAIVEDWWGFKIRNQGTNLVQFVFNSLAGLDKILKSQPWSFNKHLIVMQCYLNDTPFKDLAFEKVPF